MILDAYKPALAEAIGTFTITFVAAFSYCADSYSGGELGLVGIALAQGLALAAVISALAPISGGHVNPAVTLALLIRRAIAPVRAVVYLGAQLFGAVLAGLLVTASFAPDVWTPVHLGAPVLGSGVRLGTGIFIEAVLTFVLVLTYLRLADATPGPMPNHGLVIGLVWSALILVAGPLTGGAVNPARAFGPAFAGGEWAQSEHLVYWIGPAVGGLIAAFASLAFRPESDA